MDNHQNKVFQFCSLGEMPQDKKFQGERTFLEVGDRNIIRECCTFNRGTAQDKGTTRIGNDNLFMAYVHVAHDCIVGNNVIVANACQLAGEVEIADHAILGGGTLVHQFSKIGAHVMVQGGTRVIKDVPPYVTAGRDPLTYAGVNSVGLRRRGFSNEQITLIQDTYRIVFQSKLNTTNALAKILETIPATPERDLIVEFIKSSDRGIIKGFV